MYVYIFFVYRTVNSSVTLVSKGEKKVLLDVVQSICFRSMLEILVYGYFERGSLGSGAVKE